MSEKNPRQARVFVRSQSLFAFLNVNKNKSLKPLLLMFFSNKKRSLGTPMGTHFSTIV
ncbi:hypothetical protein PUZ01_002393 [Enterobacter cloacae]|nr:hypothetical protein [Enterobacter cloacae]EKV5785146.1 hypothetical protein [Enterobacter cloacae]